MRNIKKDLISLLGVFIEFTLVIILGFVIVPVISYCLIESWLFNNFTIWILMLIGSILGICLILIGGYILLYALISIKLFIQDMLRSSHRG